jgi:hypothetical protein
MGPVIRRDDWQERLIALVEEAKARAFDWSRFDCVTWAFDVRADLIGIDGAEPWRGRYRCLNGGLRVMRKLGHASITDLVTAQCGEPISARLAQRGDLVQLQDTALGVCLGAIAATVEDGVGLVLVPMSLATLAWRV